jgi:hypothetical protein
MSAIEVTERVFQWVAQQEGMLPSGDLSDAHHLINPPARLKEQLSALTMLTAAKLHWGCPPLGDKLPIGSGTILLAAAIGARSKEHVRIAKTLFQCIPIAASTSEMVARYGLLEKTMSELPELIQDDFRLHSPLTSVLTRPASGQESVALGVIAELLQNEKSRRTLTMHFAEPTVDTTIRKWRTSVLDRLRLGAAHERSFVIDVYEAALIHHQQASMEMVQASRSTIFDRLAAADQERLRDAISIAEWWGPLWSFHRERNDELRSRHYLHYDFLEGTKLFQICRRLLGVSSQ